MEDSSSDQKVIELLSRLKDDNNVYPLDLMDSRRQKYLQRAAQLGMGIAAGEGLRYTLKARGSTLSLKTGSWLEAALVVAILVEAGAAVYFYRHRLDSLMETVLTTSGLAATSGVQEDMIPPVLVSPLPATKISLVPTVTVTRTPTVISTAIPDISDMNNSAVNSSTPGSDDLGNNTDSSPDQGNGSPVVTPTPRGNNGDNGNHFGQTKQPPNATPGPNNTAAPNRENSQTKGPKN